MKNWMLQKVAHDQSVNAALSAKLDMIGLRCTVDPSTMPSILPFPEELTRAWTAEEPPYHVEDEDEDDEQEARHEFSPPK